MKRKPDPPGLVAWGWYAVLEKPETARPAPADSRSIAWRSSELEAFWAAWWTEHPSLDRWVSPDALGLVEGGHCFTEAISAADAAIRAAKGSRVYVKSVGVPYAVRAFTDGGRRRRSRTTDFVKVAKAFLAEHGLPPEASPDQIRSAYRKRVKADKMHPDQGGAPAAFRAFTDRKDAAVAYAKREHPSPPPKRKTRTKPSSAGQETLHHG